jgi:PAS domain S-box-containing protein
MNLDVRDGFGNGTAREACQELCVPDGLDNSLAFEPTEYPATLLLEIQRDLAISLLSCACMNDCLELLLEAAMRLPGFDCGGAYRFDEASQSLALVCHRGLSEGFVSRVSHYAADTPQVALVRAGKLVYAMRGDLPAPLEAAIRSEGLEALAVLPLRDRGSVVAALNVSSHRYPCIESASRVALESLVAQAEVAIASFHEREARLIAERQLRLAVEGAELGSWVADFETKEFNATPLAKLFHGVDVDLVLDVDTAMNGIHSDFREEVSAALRRTLSNGNLFSREYLTADGKRWIASKGRCIEDHEGKRLYGIVRDITARKEIEAALIEARDELELRVKERTAELEAANRALREKSQRLAMALEASQAGTWSLEMETGSLVLDDRECILYGFTGEDPVSFDDFVSRVHPEDRPILLERMRKSVASRGTEFWNNEFRILHPERGERWLACMCRIERDEQGNAMRVVGINFDITDRKLTEQFLRASETKFRILHESMSDAFAIVDLEGRVLESNPVFQEMLGYSQDELCGMKVRDITPEKWHAFEDQIGSSEELLVRGYSDLYEKEYVCKDGSVLPVELRVFLIRNAAGQPEMIWGIARDITHRKRAELEMLRWNQTLERRVAERTAELHQSELRFRQLAEASFEGLAVSENGILIDGNPQLAALHGYTLEEMIGRPVLDFVAPDFRDLVAQRIREGVEATYQCFSLRKDGSIFPSEVRGCMRSWQGRETRVTALRDLTEIKRAAARLQSLQTELQHAQRLGLVSEVSAGIIHQIGQPLCSMGINLSAALAQVIKCANPKCGVQPMIEDVGKDVARLRDAVVHLRSLANPSQTTHKETDLNEMISDVLGILAQEANRRRIDIEVDFSPSLPPIHVDSVQLSQVLLNLLHNAFDATENCPADRRSIVVTTRKMDDGGVEFTVRDSGSGIAPGASSELFAPFFTTKPEGIGMGLRLSRTIVHAHGGSIEGFNNPGGLGSTFRVRIPPRKAG